MTMRLSKPIKLYITKQEPYLNYQNNLARTPGDARLECRAGHVSATLLLTYKAARRHGRQEGGLA